MDLDYQIQCKHNGLDLPRRASGAAITYTRIYSGKWRLEQKKQSAFDLLIIILRYELTHDELTHVDVV